MLMLIKLLRLIFSSAASLKQAKRCVINWISLSTKPIATWSLIDTATTLTLMLPQKIAARQLCFNLDESAH